MGKEIVIEDSADSFQVSGVNGAFGEYLVYIGTVTRQSGGKPYYCFALLLKSILYQLTYVHLQCKCFQGSPNPEFFLNKQKRRGNQFCLFYNPGSSIAL